MKKTILCIKSDDCIKDKLERLFELTDVNNNIEETPDFAYLLHEFCIDNSIENHANKRNKLRND